jgi:hypothetical protein
MKALVILAALFATATASALPNPKPPIKINADHDPKPPIKINSNIQDKPPARVNV